MKETNLTNIDRLKYFFGGVATISHNKYLDKYRIILKTDDLVNAFVFEFTGNEVDKNEREVVVDMLMKYDKQMENERDLIKKGLLLWQR